MPHGIYGRCAIVGFAWRQQCRWLFLFGVFAVLDELHCEVTLDAA